MSTVRLMQNIVMLRPNDPVGQVAFVDQFLSPEECKRALSLARGQQQHDSPIGDVNRNTGEQIRKSNVSFLVPGPSSGWLFDKLEGAISQLNRRYGFELSGFYEGAQVARYEPGGHYNWHTDLGTGTTSNRKLSLSVQLSPEADYDGGELEFFLNPDGGAPRAQGALIAFPSFLVHRVAPVTRGTRYSLVSWISGPAFR